MIAQSARNLPAIIALAAGTVLPAVAGFSTDFSAAVRPQELGEFGRRWVAASLQTRDAALRSTAFEERERLALLRALTALDLGIFVSAETSLGRWLKTSPFSGERARAALGKALALLGAGEPRRAVDALRAGARDFPESAQSDEILFWLGEAAWQAEDYGASAGAFSSLLSGYPKTPMRGEALYRLGWAWGKLGRHADSASCFEEAASLSPRLKVSSQLQRGWALLALENIEGARALFEQVERENPGSVHLLESRIGQAECLYRGGDFKGADSIYNSSLKLAEGPAPRSAIRYSMAWTVLKQKQYARARAIFREVEREYPQEDAAPFAAYRAALCLLDLSKPEEALVELKQVQARYPAHEAGEWSVYSRGWIHLSKNRFNEAKSTFKSLVEEYPEGRLVAPAVYLFAATLYKERHFVEAEREFLSFADKHPSSGLADAALLWAAWAALLDSRPSDALKHAGRMRSEHPASELVPDSQVLSGEAAFALRDYRSAEAAYGRAAKAKGETRLRGLSGLGWCALAQRDWRTAERWFRTVVSESPAGSGSKVRARARLADALFNQKNFSAASEQYRQCITADDEEIGRWAQLQMGWCALREEKPEEAMRQWGQLRRRWPGSPEAPLALMAVAETLFQLERLTEAEIAYRQLEKEAGSGSPMAETASLRIGDALYNAKSYEKAILAWKEFTKSYPESARLLEALYGIQWAYMQLGEYELARREAGAFLEKFPQAGLAAEVQMMVAESYLKEKRLKEASVQFRELARKYPESVLVPAAQMKIGGIQEETGAYKEAADTYAEFIRKYPQHPLFQEAVFRSAVVRYALGDIQAAMEAFGRIADNASDPHAPEALYNVILCSKKLNDEQKMMAALKKLESGYSATQATVRGQIAVAYWLLDAGREKEAEGLFKAVVSSTYPDLSDEASFSLAEVLSGRGEDEAALSVCMASAEKLPKGGEWRVQCAFMASGLLGKLSRRDEAVDLLRRVLEKEDAGNEALANAYFAIGQHYEAQGKSKQAKQMYRECVKKSPPAELKAMAAERIAAIDAAAAAVSATQYVPSSPKKSGGGTKKTGTRGVKKPAGKKPSSKVKK